MATVTELHAQAALWTDQDWRMAVLLMEGEAPDRANGGMLVDALYTAARAHGLRMTTDPDQLPLRPVPGWRIHLENSGAITLDWPHFTPLLADAPVALPDGWRDAATELGVVVVFAGRGLGLHEHRTDGQAHATSQLRKSAEDGTLAGGAVVVAGFESTAAQLDGTISRPRRRRRHRPAEAGSLTAQHRRQPRQRWWRPITIKVSWRKSVTEPRSETIILVYEHCSVVRGKGSPVGDRR